MIGRNRFKRLQQQCQQSELVRNTVAMTTGNGVRLVFQAAYFILLARSLGPAQYGAFIGSISLVAVLYPFSMWGADGILVRNVARQKESFSDSWGNGLSMAACFGSLLLLVVLAVSHAIFSDRAPLKLVLLVGLSDLVLAGFIDLSGKAFMAFEKLEKTAQIGIALTGLRAVCAFVLYVAAPRRDAVSWAYLYLAGTAICAAWALIMTCRSLGRPRLSLSRLKADLPEGFYFSLGLSSQSIYNNIDKTMLVRLATLEATGLYSTAYRIIDLALLPVSSLLYSSYAKFFQHGSRGIKGTADYAMRFIPLGAGYGVVAGLMLFVTAPMLPIVLGPRYAGADQALRWLSPLLVIRTVHYLLSNSLTGADFQGLRSGLQLTAAVFNIGLNFLLIPVYSWRGAAWASLASDGMLAVGMASVVLFLQRTTTVHEHLTDVQTESSTGRPL